MGILEGGNNGVLQQFDIQICLNLTRIVGGWILTGVRDDFLLWEDMRFRGFIRRRKGNIVIVINASLNCMEFFHAFPLSEIRKHSRTLMNINGVLGGTLL